jgi:membrane associated rhomboid family serine protease
MLLPITHEDATARRWPWVTTSIVALCTVLFVAALGPQRKGAEALQTTVTEAAAYWRAHPYLEARPPLDRLLEAPPVQPAPVERPALRLRGRSKFDVSGNSVAPLGAAPVLDPSERDDEQKTLDAFGANVQASIDAMPLHRFGYVPADNHWLSLISSQFMHGGWLHLIFNMWFLWLCGCNLEDRWGRVVFPLFYVTAGIAAGLAHKLAFPHSAIPVVGASGAIAGAMGAFMVCFARTRIRFVYWYFLRVGWFRAPAYLMLPLWLLQEVLYALAQSSGGSVAHWAHAGGFVYGVGFALVLRATGWEARLDEAVERSVTVQQDERIMRAAELTSSGHAAEALQLLGTLARERPTDIDVHLEALRAGRAAGDRRAEVRAYAALVKLYVDQGMLDAAHDLLAEAQTASLDQIPIELRLRLADRCVVTGRLDRAWALYDDFTRGGLPDATAVKVALAQAKLARRLGRGVEERALLEAILQSPFSTAEIDESARAALSAVA